MPQLNVFFDHYRSGDDYDREAITHVMACNSHFGYLIFGYPVGIDRSSLGIVWQQYGVDKVVTEYGQCWRNDHPAGTAGD